VAQRAFGGRGDKYSERLSPEWMEKVIWKTLVALEAQAAILTPVDKGDLRDSETIATNKRSEVHGVRAMFDEQIESPTEDNLGVWGTNKEYAAAVEFGRPDMPNYPAQPYARPAADWLRMKMGAISGKQLRENFREYANRHPYRPKEYIAK